MIKFLSLMFKCAIIVWPKPMHKYNILGPWKGTESTLQLWAAIQQQKISRIGCHRERNHFLMLLCTMQRMAKFYNGKMLFMLGKFLPMWRRIQLASYATYIYLFRFSRSFLLFWIQRQIGTFVLHMFSVNDRTFCVYLIVSGQMVDFMKIRQTFIQTSSYRIGIHCLRVKRSNIFLKQTY